MTNVLFGSFSIPKEKLLCVKRIFFVRNKRSQVKVAYQKTILILFLFPDPRKWSRDEVRQWLIWMSARHSLPLDPDRFQMNGKALCLMSLAMFAVRVPLGGKLLYKDFQLRLTSAFHIENQRFINTRIK